MRRELERCNVWKVFLVSGLSVVAIAAPSGVVLQLLSPCIQAWQLWKKGSLRVPTSKAFQRTCSRLAEELMPRCCDEDDAELIPEQVVHSRSLVHHFVIYVPRTQGEREACRTLLGSRNMAHVPPRGSLTMGSMEKGYGRNNERRAGLYPKHPRHDETTPYG